MIPDGPKRFKNSCVKWTKFKTHELRTLFACLRERESILQKDLVDARAAGNEALQGFKTAQLHEVERWLCWLVANVTGSRAEVARKRRGSGADRDYLEEEELGHMSAENIIKYAVNKTLKTRRG